MHKHVWSVKALEGENKGRVVAHCNRILLDKPKFKVSEAGRQRVLREKAKNVHAGVVGRVLFIEQRFKPLWLEKGTEVTYNPYKFETFVNRKTLGPVYNALTAYMDTRKVWAWG